MSNTRLLFVLSVLMSLGSFAMAGQSVRTAWRFNEILPQVTSPRTIEAFKNSRRMSIHSAFVLVAGGIFWGAVAFFVPRKYQRLDRQKRGQCPICGYDLRESPDRCPECGTPVEKPKTSDTRFTEFDKT